jgi:hypothetical protein
MYARSGSFGLRSEEQQASNPGLPGTILPRTVHLSNVAALCRVPRLASTRENRGGKS